MGYPHLLLHKTTPHAQGDEARSYLLHQTGWPEEDVNLFTPRLSSSPRTEPSRRRSASAAPTAGGDGRNPPGSVDQKGFPEPAAGQPVVSSTDPLPERTPPSPRGRGQHL